MPCGFLRPMNGISISEAVRTILDIELSVANAPNADTNASTRQSITALRRLHSPAATLERESVAISGSVIWFIHHRLLDSERNIPPAEAEAHYYRQLIEADAMV